MFSQVQPRAVKSKTEKALPKTGLLPGAVAPQYIRCGRPNCHCRDGSALHGPYYYRFFRMGGRLCKRYVPRREVEQVRTACREWRDLQALIRGNRAQHRQVFRQMRQMLRDLERAQ